MLVLYVLGIVDDIGDSPFMIYKSVNSLLFWVRCSSLK